VSPATTAPTLWNYDLCAQYPGVVADGATVYLPCTDEMPPRRYLVVQIESDNQIFNFCEIEVYIRRKPVHVILILYCQGSWWRGSVVERRSLAGELSLSCG